VQHNVPVALEHIASIRAAINQTPSDWKASVKIWEEGLDYSISIGLFQVVEPGKPSRKVDPDETRVRMEAEELYGALRARDRKTVDALLISIEQKLKALVVRVAVA